VAERYLVTLLLYFCCCMVLITRMQTQHFVPLVFWAVMICTFELAQLAKWMAEKSVNTNLLKGLGCAIFLALISLNAMNRYRVVDQILRTGGKGKYTSQINVMSEQALQNANAGEKEFYLFPEWGFMAGFNYITRNTIAFSSAFELEDIRGYLDEGYEIEILTWEEEKIPEYLDAIESLPDVRIEQTQYMQNDGQVAFYKLEVTQG
jgi:hypothetical protein